MTQGEHEEEGERTALLQTEMRLRVRNPLKALGLVDELQAN